MSKDIDLQPLTSYDFVYLTKVPEIVNKIADDEDDCLFEQMQHEERLVCFQFMADMINRLCAMLIVVSEAIAFFSTVVPLYARYTLSNGDSIIQQLSELEEN